MENGNSAQLFLLREGETMRRLRDYSGQLNPKIKLENFSKDVLVKLLKMYSRLYLAIDGFWYLSVKEKVNNDMALACDFWVWGKQCKNEMERITQLLNIQGKDVSSFLKTLQLSPWMWNYQYEIEVKNSNFGILTVIQCPTLEALEKEGEGREKTFCKTVEAAIFKMYVDCFNPQIGVNYLKLPPRKSKDEIACQWEFKM
jgi:hypothetical protein